MQRDLKRPRDLVRFVRLPPMRCGHPRSSTGAAGWRDEQLGSALFGRVGEAFVREKGDWPSQDPHSLSAAPLPPRRLAFAAPTLSHRAFPTQAPPCREQRIETGSLFPSRLLPRLAEPDYPSLAISGSLNPPASACRRSGVCTCCCTICRRHSPFGHERF